MKNKLKTASMRPSPLASTVTIVGLLIFLIFGIFLMSDAPDEPAIFIFRIIWIFACIGGIIYSIRNLSTYSKEQKNKIPPTAGDVIELVSEDETAGDFETRLRKLEFLKKDGLITEEEYQIKRKEIMNEKW